MDIKFTLMSVLFCIPFISQAAQWNILPQESSIQFVGTQNNAPIKGKFDKIEGTVDFDPDNLSTSKITLHVDTNSLNMTFKDISDILKSNDWLAVTSFPQATFETHEIEKIDDKSYRAKGQLTIRDKTLPSDVQFSLIDYSPQKTTVNGQAAIKRTAYGIGQGEWASTDEIKDDVKINFNLHLEATPKS